MRQPAWLYELPMAMFKAAWAWRWHAVFRSQVMDPQHMALNVHLPAADLTPLMPKAIWTPKHPGYCYRQVSTTGIEADAMFGVLTLRELLNATLILVNGIADVLVGVPPILHASQAHISVMRVRYVWLQGQNPDITALD